MSSPIKVMNPKTGRPIEVGKRTYNRIFGKMTQQNLRDEYCNEFHSASPNQERLREYEDEFKQRGIGYVECSARIPVRARSFKASGAAAEVSPIPEEGYVTIASALSKTPEQALYSKYCEEFHKKAPNQKLLDVYEKEFQARGLFAGC